MRTPIRENSKLKRFNPAVLPMEYVPRLPRASDGKHTRHYLSPGKVFAAAQPFAVNTVVGSGVVLCLFDMSHRIGGANQFVLPEGPKVDQDSSRYGNVANPLLLARLLELGASLETLEAKIFGGSEPIVRLASGEQHLGSQNVQAASDFLAAQGIRLVRREVGGARGRKVVFQTDDGQTWVEQL